MRADYYVCMNFFCFFSLVPYSPSVIRAIRVKKKKANNQAKASDNLYRGKELLHRWRETQKKKINSTKSTKNRKKKRTYQEKKQERPTQRAPLSCDAYRLLLNVRKQKQDKMRKNKKKAREGEWERKKRNPRKTGARVHFFFCKPKYIVSIYTYRYRYR